MACTSPLKRSCNAAWVDYATGCWVYCALFRSATNGYFNPIQTQTFSTLYEGGENAVVCAPCGSDTIVCGEFAILRQFKLDPAATAVYVSPKVSAPELER